MATASAIDPKPTGARLSRIHWKSSDPLKARVLANGNIEGLAVGTVRITATDEDSGVSVTTTIAIHSASTVVVQKDVTVSQQDVVNAVTFAGNNGAGTATVDADAIDHVTLSLTGTTTGLSNSDTVTVHIVADQDYTISGHGSAYDVQVPVSGLTVIPPQNTNITLADADLVQYLTFSGIDARGSVALKNADPTAHLHLELLTTSHALHNGDHVSVKATAVGAGWTINGHSEQTFTQIPVSGLTPRTVVTVDPNDVISAVTFSGNNGAGSAVVDSDAIDHVELSITGTHTGLSNQDQITVRITAARNYVFSGDRTSYTQQVTVTGLTTGNQVVTIDPADVVSAVHFSGNEGAGRATIDTAAIDHVTLTLTGKTTALSNGEHVTVRITAKSGYEITGGQHEITQQVDVKGLVSTTGTNPGGGGGTGSTAGGLKAIVTAETLGSGQNAYYGVYETYGGSIDNRNINSGAINIDSVYIQNPHKFVIAVKPKTLPQDAFTSVDVNGLVLTTANATFSHSGADTYWTWTITPEQEAALRGTNTFTITFTI